MEEIEEEKPGYYSIIPASVRYDENLKANEKLLYSEITVLCNKNGFCYASNEYFANLYHTTKETVSRWINSLKKCGYIGAKILYKDDDKTIDKRVIWIAEVVLREVAKHYCQKNQEGIDEIINTYIQKCQEGIDEKVKDNNTSINNIKKRKYKKKKNDEIDEPADYFKQFITFWKEYPKKENKKKTIEWFKKNKPDEKLMKTILEKLKLFKKTEKWKKNNGQFIPMPTTWLNGKRWEDEITISDNTEESVYGNYKVIL